MTLKRDHLKLAVKLLVGCLLIYYVFFHSKMVDFQILKRVLASPVNLAISIVFLFTSAVLCAFRWFLLVRAQKLTLSFKDLLELTMIGNFFNTFMPGAVGGDLIKAWYVAGHQPNMKTKAIFTVLLDRLIGLTVIILYSASTLVFYTHWLSERPELKAIAYGVWGFTGLCVLVSVVFFSPAMWNWEPIKKLLLILRRSEKLSLIVDAAFLYQNKFRTVILSLFISALSIFGTNILYSLQGKALGIEMDLAHYFFIVPLGLTVSAIPLLPGGIGVGQVAFHKIFSWTGVANPEWGATLCTVMQVYTILFNCVGGIFYIRFKKKPVSKKTPADSATITMPTPPLGNLL